MCLVEVLIDKGNAILFKGWREPVTSSSLSSVRSDPASESTGTGLASSLRRVRLWRNCEIWARSVGRERHLLEYSAEVRLGWRKESSWAQTLFHIWKTIFVPGIFQWIRHKMNGTKWIDEGLKPQGYGLRKESTTRINTCLSRATDFAPCWRILFIIFDVTI